MTNLIKKENSNLTNFWGAPFCLRRRVSVPFFLKLPAYPGTSWQEAWSAFGTDQMSGWLIIWQSLSIGLWFDVSFESRSNIPAEVAVASVNKALSAQQCRQLGSRFEGASQENNSNNIPAVITMVIRSDSGQKALRNCEWLEPKSLVTSCLTNRPSCQCL